MFNYLHLSNFSDITFYCQQLKSLRDQLANVDQLMSDQSWCFALIRVLSYTRHLPSNLLTIPPVKAPAARTMVVATTEAIPVVVVVGRIEEEAEVAGATPIRLTLTFSSRCRRICFLLTRLAQSLAHKPGPLFKTDNSASEPHHPHTIRLQQRATYRTGPCLLLRPNSHAHVMPTYPVPKLMGPL